MLQNVCPESCEFFRGRAQTLETKRQCSAKATELNHVHRRNSGQQANLTATTRPRAAKPTWNPATRTTSATTRVEPIRNATATGDDGESPERTPSSERHSLNLEPRAASIAGHRRRDCASANSVLQRNAGYEHEANGKIWSTERAHSDPITTILWNCEGVKNLELLPTDELKHVDCLVLCETWSLEPFSIDGFYEVHCVANKATGPSWAQAEESQFSTNLVWAVSLQF